MCNGVELGELELVLWADLDECALVVGAVTVVGCREEGDKLAFAKELVAILNDLVSTADQVHVVFLQEARYNVWTESE